ncbi:MAG: SDR family NAD(P)-dependent oxidoreductase [Flavobacteriaceae bacterium]|nr:SDR family oxidoreductase [Flavobacteriia bacterium]
MPKTIVVTGSSKGIGRELALQAAEKGHRVFALSRNVTSLQATSGVIPLQLDLSDTKDVQQAVNEIRATTDTIDVLINNAGILLHKPFLETTSEDFHQVFETNVFGLVSITQALLPFMKVNSHVVNISSMGGIGGSSKFAGLSAYSSSKGAVSILTELLAEEFKATGPKFNALALGAVQTEMLTQAFPEFKAPIQANEMADYILQFALEGHRYFNGKVLPVSSSTP